MVSKEEISVHEDLIVMSKLKEEYEVETKESA